MSNKYLRWATLLLSFWACSARAEDFFFNSAGTRIHYTIDGHGAPVVLIHGLGASIATNWAQPGIINALADTYQVIAIDNRGHGQTDKPHDPREYGNKMVEDVIRLMDHLKIARAHVVGYSLGAMITSVLVAEYPGRLRTATLGGAAKLYVRGRQGHRDMIQALAESLEHGKGMAPLIADLGYPPEQVEPLNKMFLAMNDPLAVAAVVRGEMDFLPNLLLSEAQLRATKVPTLLLNGEYDPRRSDVDALAGLMPSLKVVVIPGANHVTAPRNAEFVKSLKAFLDEHSPN